MLLTHISYHVFSPIKLYAFSFNMVTIDRSGNEIEFPSIETDDEGQEQVKPNDIMRVKKVTNMQSVEST